MSFLFCVYRNEIFVIEPDYITCLCQKHFDKLTQKEY